MSRPLIIIAGAADDERDEVVDRILDAFRDRDERPRITATSGDPDQIILPGGMHTTYS